MAREDVLRVNAFLPQARCRSQSRLLRAVNAYVRDCFMPASMLVRAPRRETDDRLPVILAAIKGAAPILQAICDLLQAIHERTLPRGQASSRLWPNYSWSAQRTCEC